MSKDPLDHRVFIDGEVLFEKGDRASEAYLIVDGRVRIVNEGDGEDEEIGIRGPNDIVGEMAIISNEPRMATARAIGDISCYAISRQTMNTIVGSADPETRSMILFLVDFLRDLHLKAEGKPIVPGGDDSPEGAEAWRQRVATAKQYLKAAATDPEPAHLAPILGKLRLVLVKRVREVMAQVEKSAAGPGAAI